MPQIAPKKLLAASLWQAPGQHHQGWNSAARSCHRNGRSRSKRALTMRAAIRAPALRCDGTAMNLRAQYPCKRPLRLNAPARVATQARQRPRSPDALNHAAAPRQRSAHLPAASSRLNIGRVHPIRTPSPARHWPAGFSAPSAFRWPCPALPIGPSECVCSAPDATVGRASARP